MSLILNIRGTNGSGKSTLMRQLMERLGPKIELAEPSGKVWGYELLHNIRVLGRYETQCGGVDTLPDFAATRKGLRILAGMGHVLFEGVLWSTVFKQSNELALEFPQHHCIFAMFDTPAEVCLARVKQRQKDRGKERPFDEALLLDKIEQITRRQQALKDAGWDTRSIPYTNPLGTVLSWLESENVIPTENKDGNQAG